MSKMTSGKLGSLGSNKNTSLKIFGASEMMGMDKTPTNCIPRLCTLKVSKMVLTKPINVELSSVYLVIKMAHSRRTIRSAEININSSSSPIINKELISGENLECSPTKQKSILNQQNDNQINNDLPTTSNQQTNLETTSSNLNTIQNNEPNLVFNPTNEQNINSLNSNQQSPITPPSKDNPLLYALSPEQQLQQHLETLQLHTIELETKITFQFQYPHLLKKGTNQLQIMIQRRKKYKNRAILGFKTLAIGFINLQEIFANSINVNSNNSNLISGTINLSANLNSNQQSTLSNISTISTNQSQQQQISIQQTIQQPTNSTIELTSSSSKDILNTNQQPAQQANSTSTQQSINELQTPNIILIHPELKVDLKCNEMVKKTQTKPQHINKSQLLMANIVISSICLEPVTQEHRRQKSLDKAIANQTTIQESEDEEFFNWNEDNSDTDAGEQSTSQPQEQSNSAKQKLNKWRRQMNSRKARKLFTSLDNKNTSDEQRNLNVKQRLVNLIRKLSRIPDSASFESEEQYEAALERELMVNVVDNVEDEQDIEDLLAASVNLDEGDVCLDDLDLSDYSTREFDDCLSITSTPKPSLRPFFSHSTLVGGPEDADDDLKNYVKKHIQEEEENEESENQIPEGAIADSTDAVGLLQPKNRKWNEKRSKLFSKTTNYTNYMKDRKSLMTIIKLLAKHKNQNFLPKESDNNLKKSFIEQLEKVLPSTTDEQQTTIPEQISFIQSNDFTFLPLLKNKLTELNHCVIETSTFLEMKTTFTYLINRIQKFCNCNSRAPNTIKICIFGSDAYINTVLRTYVDLLSNKSPEWQSYFRFYPIPLCNSGSITLSLFLGTIDPQYQTNFCNGKWKELVFDNQNQNNLVQELMSRVKNYLNNSTITVQIPIAESMIMYKTVQAFIPFICSVKIGYQDQKNSKNSGNVSIEEDKQQEQLTQPTTSSPPNNSTNTTINTANQQTNKTDLQNVINNLNNLNLSTVNTSTITSSNGANNLLDNIGNKEQQQIHQQQTISQQSPPTSPGTSNNIQNILSNQGANQQNINQFTQQPFSPTTLQSNTSTFLLNNGSNLVSPESKLKDTIKSDECLDLQIDYWITSAKQQLNAAIQTESSSNRKIEFNNKTTLKNTFRTLQISRLPCTTENHLTSPSLTLSYLTKEKKQKIMRLGKKKDRDPDIKFQVVEGIHRLVCSYKNSSLKVNVDGVDFTGVKFFQLTAQWQTHIKSFPIALFGSIECPLLSTNITKSNRI